MQIVNIRHYGNQKILYTMEVKPAHGKEPGMFDILKLVEKDTDALKAAGITKKPDDTQNTGILGITSTCQTGCYKGTVPEGPLESCMRLGRDSGKWKPDSVRVTGDDGTVEDTGIRLAVSSYLCGLVLGTGTTYCGGLFGWGGAEPAYLHKITAKSLFSGRKSNARIFENPAKVTKWVEKYAHILKRIDGYHWNVEYTTPEAEDYIKQKLGTGTAAARKWEEDMLHLQKVLDALNKDIADIVKKPVFMTDNARIAAEKYENGDDKDVELDDADYDEEILYRMKSFDMWNRVINAFKKDKTIFMSDNGIIYDLDDGAKQASETLKRYGCRPYHVIRTETECGTMYDVLYVSAFPHEWPQFQRPDRQGIIGSFCISSCTGESGEFGDIMVKSVGGGLKRIG